MKNKWGAFSDDLPERIREGRIGFFRIAALGFGKKKQLAKICVSHFGETGIFPETVGPFFKKKQDFGQDKPLQKDNSRPAKKHSKVCFRGVQLMKDASENQTEETSGQVPKRPNSRGMILFYSSKDQKEKEHQFYQQNDPALAI